MFVFVSSATCLSQGVCCVLLLLRPLWCVNFCLFNEFRRALVLVVPRGGVSLYEGLCSTQIVGVNTIRGAGRLRIGVLVVLPRRRRKCMGHGGRTDDAL